MGVSGCGKSSVGHELARLMGAAFIDGDDLHPEANIAKMSRGAPLTDADRAPWLAAVGRALGAAEGDAVIACSALKRAYREMIAREAGAPVFFAHLAGSKTLIASRMAMREGHFMPPALLDSQFAALEPPGGDEPAADIPIDGDTRAVAAAALKAVEAFPWTS